MPYTNKTTKTKKKIEAAMLTLMETKKFETITINDITELADINRSTFYRHYYDKYEVIEKIEEHIFYQLDEFHNKITTSIDLQNITKNFDFKNYMDSENNFFKFFEPYIPQLQIILGDNGNPESLKRLRKKMKNLYADAVKLVAPKFNEYQYELILNHQVNSFIGSLIFWTTHADLTSEELYSFYYNINTYGIVGFVKDNM